jgi:hypothetical protein
MNKYNTVKTTSSNLLEHFTKVPSSEFLNTERFCLSCQTDQGMSRIYCEVIESRMYDTIVRLIFNADSDYITGKGQSEFNNLYGLTDGVCKLCKIRETVTIEQLGDVLAAFNADYVCFACPYAADYLSEYQSNYNLDIVSTSCLQDAAIVMPVKNVEYVFDKEPVQWEIVPAYKYDNEEAATIIKHYFNYNMRLLCNGYSSTFYKIDNITS